MRDDFTFACYASLILDQFKKNQQETSVESLWQLFMTMMIMLLTQLLITLVLRLQGEKWCGSIIFSVTL